MKSMDVTLASIGLCLLIALFLPEGTRAAPSRRIMMQLRSAKMDGPPERPSEFTSVDELNRYLAKVAKYYKMMGRPRFGKRSYDDDEMSYSDNGTEDKYLDPLYTSTKYTKLWDLLNDAATQLGR